jgi:hypothetical protein
MLSSKSRKNMLSMKLNDQQKVSEAPDRCCTHLQLE